MIESKKIQFKKPIRWVFQFQILIHWQNKVIDLINSTIKTLKFKLKIFIHFHTQVVQQVLQKAQCFPIEISLLFYLHLQIMMFDFMKVMFIYHFYPYHMYLRELLQLVMYLQDPMLCTFYKYFRFYAGDMLKLKADCQLVRPTVFIAVPRIFNRIVDKVREQFK